MITRKGTLHGVSFQATISVALSAKHSTLEGTTLDTALKLYANAALTLDTALKLYENTALKLYANTALTLDTALRKTLHRKNTQLQMPTLEGGTPPCVKKNQYSYVMKKSYLSPIQTPQSHSSSIFWWGRVPLPSAGHLHLLQYPQLQQDGAQHPSYRGLQLYRARAFC